MDVTSEPSVLKNMFFRGMRRLSSGVCVVATESNGVLAGMTATAVCSLTAEPPSLIVCLNKDSRTHNAIAASRHLTVNVLRQEQRRLAECFAGHAARSGTRKFQIGTWPQTDYGLPFLSDALAVFFCTVQQVSGFNSHSLFICGVDSVRTANAGRPLLYFDQSYRTLTSVV